MEVKNTTISNTTSNPISNIVELRNNLDLHYVSPSRTPDTEKKQKDAADAAASPSQALQNISLIRETYEKLITLRKSNAPLSQSLMFNSVEFEAELIAAESLAENLKHTSTYNGVNIPESLSFLSKALYKKLHQLLIDFTEEVGT